MAVHLRWLVASLFATSFLILLLVANRSDTKAESNDTRPRVLYLHTEFLPYRIGGDKDLSNRLGRELVRQALLVTAREAFRLQTCDETLQESLPDNANIVHLAISERCQPNGKWHVKLCKFVEGQDLQSAPVIWETTYDCPAEKSSLYSAIVPKLEADTRSALIQNALSDLEQIEKLSSDSKQANSAKNLDWPKLVKPYASSNRAETKKVGVDVKELNAWSTYLHFQLCNFARYPEMLFGAANDVVKACPTAYGIFDELSHHGQQLGVVRMGAQAAPQSFGYFLPVTLGGVPDLPKELRDLLPTDETKLAALRKLINDPNPDDDFSGTPGYFAAKLRECTRQKTDGDLSWSALASILEEEQFVEAAMFLHVATNATETSLQKDVDSVMPFVKDHRYAPFVESFTLGPVRDPGRLFQYFGKMVVRDPRENMYPMFARIGYLKDENGTAIGPALIEQTSCNFTLPDIVEFLFPIGPGAINSDPARTLLFANEAQKIAPGTPGAARVMLQLTPSPKPDDLARWEQTASDDPISLMALGDLHLNVNDKEAAVRCWKKSIAVLPTVTAVRQLADYYRSQGDLKNWEDTLSSFLSTPDLGLQHAMIQQELALGLARQGEWKRAKPFALKAAQTYSNGGLSVAGYISEGLADWKLSEELVRAAASNYPSHAGSEWYFWCRRTGRGDVKAAEQVAERYFALPQPHPTENTFMVRGLYEILKNDLQAAQRSFQQALQQKRSFTNTFIVAHLAKELKDDATRTAVIAAMEQEVAAPTVQPQRAPEVDRAGTLILDLMKNGNPTPDRMAAIEDALLKITERDRMSCTGYCYAVGTELESLGQKKEAEKYWRRSLIDAGRNQILATLAGAKLAKQNGTSRPDDDALEPKDLWPPPKLLGIKTEK